MTDELIAQRTQELLAKRASSSSICPSEVARSLASAEQDWRALMPDIRRVANSLTIEGKIDVTQRGQPVSALTAKGAIRISRRAPPS